MPLTSATVNALWGATSSPAWIHFRKALRTPATVQERVLLACIRRNADTVFGRAHDFASIRTIAEYQQRVAPASYDDLMPLVHRAARGESKVLTNSPIERLVPSSGSTAAAKFIPFTADLRAEFTRAIDAWLVDLFRRDRSLIGGPSYWAISPAVANYPSIPGAVIPIGFDSDSRYLGGARTTPARCILAVPDAVARVSDVRAFQYITALFLLHARNLRVVSVWHPSFLERLLDVIAINHDRLLSDIEHGTVSASPPIATEIMTAVLPFLRPNCKRAKELRNVGGHSRQIWPHLSLISCWGDGPSAAAAAQLTNRCGGIVVQPKGLLASEGVVTIPFEGRHPVAIRSHFFEFLDADGAVRLVHELRRGHDYTVLFTTGGGLYRYRLGDRVRVDDVVYHTPSLRFVGRDDRVSDLCGEKLSDGFVSGVLERLFAGAPPRFALLAPHWTETRFAYALFVSSDATVSPNLALRLEHALRANPHYAWCVDLGQLAPARIIRVGSGAADAFVDACVAGGQRLGDVKAASLSTATDWHERLPALTEAAC
jgi:GH3 auxin-responsive promoter